MSDDYGPKSKQMRAEKVGEYFLTTALWAPYYDSESYETGVRFGGDFRLLQHDGLNWERGHDWVKKQIIAGVPYQQLTPWMREEQ